MKRILGLFIIVVVDSLKKFRLMSLARLLMEMQRK